MRTWIGITMLAALAVSACGPDESADVAGRGDDGLVVVAVPTEPDVLNPLIHTAAASGQVLVLMVDSLMEMGEDFRYAPRVAEKVEASPDGLQLTVTLRPWRWQDGEPLTAADVKATIDLYRDPLVGSPRAGGRLANIVEVEVLADDVVRYTFAERRADQIPTLGHFILPAHVVDELDPAAVASWPINDAPVANGMFVLEEWRRGESLLLARNEAYDGVKPILDHVLFRIIPDETTRLAELETGGVDFVGGVSPQQAGRLAGHPDVTVSRAAGRLVGMIYWNHERELFADRRVRKALSMAVDRGTIVDGLLNGYGRPAAGPLPPAVWAYDASVESDPFDPVAAAALLDEAGWRDDDGDGVRERAGRPFRFTLLTRKGDPVREDGSALIRQNLAAVGVEVETRVLEFSTVIDYVKEGRFDAYLGVFSARLAVDPSGLLASDSHDRWNYGHYASARADSLMDAAMALTERGDALPVWSEFLRHCAADQPMAFLYYPDEISAHRTRVRDVRPHVLSPMNNIREWRIDEGR